MPGESFVVNCSCEVIPGTTPPSIAPYVVSLNDLHGIITLAGTGATSITSSGNTITIGLTAAAGLGSVTSVAIASGSNNLTVSGSPITTNGTITLDLAGALDSIASLTTIAEQMIYTTAANEYATTNISAFTRTVLNDVNATEWRSTLGLVIGTNVQAFSQDLADFVANAVWTGSDLNITGGTLSAGAISTNAITAIGGLDLGGSSITNGSAATFAGNVTALEFIGGGVNLTGLSGSAIGSGTVGVARGGTGLNSYAIGDIIYASGATTLAKLADVAAGSYLRSGGVGTAPVWSTLTLPNAGTTGDLFYASATNVMGRITAVATGNALISGGVTTAPSWGKITSSHVNSTIATISSGTNSDIGAFSNDITFQGIVQVNDIFNAIGEFWDASGSPGNAGDIFTSTGTGSDWTNQIAVSTLRIDTLLSSEGTLTAAGVTGAQTINKMTGTVRFAAGASSLIVTNNLATTSTRVLATVCTNDATAEVKNVTVTTGSFTIVLVAAATAETEVFWELRGIT